MSQIRGKVKEGMTRPRRVEMMVVKGKAVIQTPIAMNLEYISRVPNKAKQRTCTLAKPTCIQPRPVIRQSRLVLNPTPLQEVVIRWLPEVGS